MKWHVGVYCKSKRLRSFIWHKSDVDWYWLQVKLEIKLRKYYDR